MKRVGLYVTPGLVQYSPEPAGLFLYSVSRQLIVNFDEISTKDGNTRGVSGEGPAVCCDSYYPGLNSVLRFLKGCVFE
jgi:hypothetical protein